MLTKLEKNDITKSYNFGYKRVVGAFSDIDEARKAVVNNSCDICEQTYKYALIEEVEIGLYPDVLLQELYRTDNMMKKILDKEFYNANLTYEKMDIPKNFPAYSLVIA
ncbi:hypothetical protein [Bacillus toyonensis]|uniref:hypothetical protein n=1 Tax=Bacillus toyonensis TaxID=155322 RepID=UPI002E233D8A|nr:hypothetical protein [Bacillus toyonensis]